MLKFRDQICVGHRLDLMDDFAVQKCERSVLYSSATLSPWPGRVSGRETEGACEVLLWVDADFDIEPRIDLRCAEED